jgi:hypothetical protein
MFNSDKTGDKTKDLGWSALRLKQDLFVRNKLLRRGGDGTITHDGHLGNFHDVRIRIVSLCRFADGQGGGQAH